MGSPPAVALVDPKFPHNVGAAVRAASCHGVRQVWFSGDRVRLDGAKRQRLPRVGSDLGPCRGPRATLQRATGHTGPGTSDSPIMTNWLSCRWTC
jgi:hypothetical protein